MKLHLNVIAIIFQNEAEIGDEGILIFLGKDLGKEYELADSSLKPRTVGCQLVHVHDGGPEQLSFALDGVAAHEQGQHPQGKSVDDYVVVLDRLGIVHQVGGVEFVPPGGLGLFDVVDLKFD